MNPELTTESTQTNNFLPPRVSKFHKDMTIPEIKTVIYDFYNQICEYNHEHLLNHLIDLKTSFDEFMKFNKVCAFNYLIKLYIVNINVHHKSQFYDRTYFSEYIASLDLPIRVLYMLPKSVLSYRCFYKNKKYIDTICSIYIETIANDYHKLNLIKSGNYNKLFSISNIYTEYETFYTDFIQKFSKRYFRIHGEDVNKILVELHEFSVPIKYKRINYDNMNLKPKQYDILGNKLYHNRNCRKSNAISYTIVISQNNCDPLLFLLTKMTEKYNGQYFHKEKNKNIMSFDTVNQYDFSFSMVFPKSKYIVTHSSVPNDVTDLFVIKDPMQTCDFTFLQKHRETNMLPLLNIVVINNIMVDHTFVIVRNEDMIYNKHIIVDNSQELLNTINYAVSKKECVNITQHNIASNELCMINSPIPDTMEAGYLNDSITELIEFYDSTTTSFNTAANLNSGNNNDSNSHSGSNSDNDDDHNNSDSDNNDDNNIGSNSENDDDNDSGSSDNNSGSNSDDDDNYKFVNEQEMFIKFNEIQRSYANFEYDSCSEYSFSSYSSSSVDDSCYEENEDTSDHDNEIVEQQNKKNYLQLSDDDLLIKYILFYPFVCIYYFLSFYFNKVFRA